MKKTEMTVSMPLTSYNEYEEYKSRYEEIVSALAECFDASLTASNGVVDFDARKALEICKRFMPFSMREADIEVVS